MQLKVNLAQQTRHQVHLQDVSDISNGVSRVILDFIEPIKKRIELNGTTKVKAYNFVNPFLNTFLTLNDTDLGSTKGFKPDIYEIDYSVHYPFREELFVTVGHNELHGINMMDVLDDANWLYINEEYYRVIREYSTQDYLFLDRPVEKMATVGEVAYRDKVYLPLIEQFRELMAKMFRRMARVTTDSELERVRDASNVLIGLVDNVRHEDIASAREQILFLKQLLQWDLEKQLLSY